MKPFIIITKKTLAVIISAIIIFLLIISRVFATSSAGIDGSTNYNRVAYLESLGILVDDSDVSSKEIVIPETFNNIYKEYNTLQKKAGFNLIPYKNKTATLYTYRLSNKEEQARLIVYKNQIIGGDIADINVNGSMKPLVK